MYIPDLSLSETTFIFGENSSLVVPQSAYGPTGSVSIGSFNINTSLFFGCSTWDGIDVEGDVTLKVNNSFIRDADIAIEGTEKAVIRVENGSKITDSKRGIQSKEESTIIESDSELSNLHSGILNFDGKTSIAVSNTNFLNCSNNGIFSTGAHNLAFVENSTFQKCSKGISVANGNTVDISPPDQSRNEFIACDIGIAIFGTEATIRRNNFSQCNTGIDLNFGSGLIRIEDNNIGFKTNGISSNLSTSRILNNNIGLDDNAGFGNIAIDLVSSNNTLVKSNVILARKRGISTIFTSSAELDDNSIDIVGGNFSSIGINEALSANDIQDNIINLESGEAGIRTTGSINLASNLSFGSKIKLYFRQ